MPWAGSGGAQAHWSRSVDEAAFERLDSSGPGSSVEKIVCLAGCCACGSRPVNYVDFEEDVKNLATVTGTLFHIVFGHLMISWHLFLTFLIAVSRPH